MVHEGSQVHVLVVDVETRHRTRLVTERLDQIAERRVSTKCLRACVPDFEKRRRPLKRARQQRELVAVPAQQVALERAAQIANVIRSQMKNAREGANTGQVPLLIRKEDLPHPGELHLGLDFVALFGPVRKVDFAARDGLGAIGIQIDPAQAHMGSVQREARVHVGPHRRVLLDLDRAAAERRLPVILREVPDVELQIAADDAPRDVLLHRLKPVRAVIEKREPPAGGVKIAQRDREGPRLLRLGVVPRNLWEVVLVRPLLDDHVPVGHLDRCDRELGLPLNRRGPVESDRQVLRREERADPPRAGRQSPDHRRRIAR